MTLRISVGRTYTLVGTTALSFGLVSSHFAPHFRWGFIAPLFSLPFLVAGAKWSHPRRLIDGGLTRWTIWTYVITLFVAYEGGAATTQSGDIMGTGYWLVFAGALLLPVSVTWLFILVARFEHLSRSERVLPTLCGRNRLLPPPGPRLPVGLPDRVALQSRAATNNRRSRLTPACSGLAALAADARR